MFKRGTLNQFGIFAIVGFIATVINLVFLYIFTEFLGIYYMFSAVLAFFIADLVKYIINTKWTFNTRLRRNFFRRYYKFFCVSMIALVLNLGLLYSLTEFLGVYYLVSQVIAIAITLWINFIGNKFWTYKR